jgi:hypothetical protein
MKLADRLKAIIKEQKKTNRLLQQLISLENNRDKAAMIIITSRLRNSSKINERQLAGLLLEYYQTHW